MVLSRTFFLWVMHGIIGGVISGVYWMATYSWFGLFLKVGWSHHGKLWIPGRPIHLVGNPGEIHLINENK